MADDKKMKYIICEECGKREKTPSGNGRFNNFYKCSNFYGINKKYKTYGAYTVCKECLMKRCLDENGTFSKQQFVDLLRYKLNKPYKESYFKKLTANNSVNLTSMLGDYLKRFSMAKTKDLTWEDSDFDILNGETPEEKEEITEEDDKLVYSEKWRGKYTSSDIRYLDEYLLKLQDDFNILTTNHLDYAKKIAKASLATDKAYEDMLNDTSGTSRYKELQKVFDDLSKSAQFSESNRNKHDTGVTGISQVVDKIESREWIYDCEKFEEDALDHILAQFQNIDKSL